MAYRLGSNSYDELYEIVRLMEKHKDDAGWEDKSLKPVSKPNGDITYQIWILNKCAVSKEGDMLFENKNGWLIWKDQESMKQSFLMLNCQNMTNLESIDLQSGMYVNKQTTVTAYALNHENIDNIIRTFSKYKNGIDYYITTSLYCDKVAIKHSICSQHYDIRISDGDYVIDTGKEFAFMEKEEFEKDYELIKNSEE
jgi:hypothetical protein